MIIYARELKAGDLFLVDPIGIAPPLHRENLKLDLYFVIDVRQEGRIAHAWYHFKILRMDHDGSPMIVDLSAGRNEVFAQWAIPCGSRRWIWACQTPSQNIRYNFPPFHFHDYNPARS